MSKGNYSANVHLQQVEDAIDNDVRYLDPEKFGDTVVMQIAGITFFVTPEQARQIVGELCVATAVLDVEVPA